MANQAKQAGCFNFGKRRAKRVEPDGEHNLRRDEQSEPAPSGGLQPQPRDEQSEPVPSGGLQPQPQPQPRDEQNEPAPSDGLQPQPQPQPRDEQSEPAPSGGLQPQPANLDSGARSSLAESLEGRVNRITDEDFRERNNALRIDLETDDIATKLKTNAVDFHNQENRKAHRTDEYQMQELIIRRGQAFDITVTFNRVYNPEDDVIFVQFVTGKRPQESKGSLVRVAIQDTLTPTKWGMQVKEANGNTVRLSMMSAAKAIIGLYQVMIVTNSKDSSGEISWSSYKDEKEIYILFNAWCSEDTVYMESEEHRNEYVLEDSGYIWKGVSGWFSPTPWNFDQFEDVALNSALWLLDKYELSSIARDSPIIISRTISAMVNSNDRNGGVLTGRWTNDYPDGTTNPLEWTGSTPILEEFWKTKKDVKYGQCWVFSGLVTTLMRALGIPTRSVTNFDSAHDTDASMTIDYHFDEDWEMIDYLNDSVWNYHVWNESWFKRPDLPDGHDGWQVHDATPQETSLGVFRCGPASVKAIKNGEVYLPYDTGFVFAEVNGDRVYWDVKADGSMKVTSVDKKCIGNDVSTKAAGGESREDLTQEYKYPDGSEEERNAVELAFQFSSRKDHEIYKSEVEDVNFRLEMEDTVYAGNSFDVVVVVENKSEVTREIKVNFTAVLIFYTGVPAKKVKGNKFTFLLNSQAEKRFVLKLEPKDYITPKTSVGDSSVKLYVKGMVMETGQSYVSQKIVELTKPTIKVEPSKTQIKVGDDVQVTAIFTNPLPIPLTNGKFHLAGHRMKPKTLTVKCNGPVGAKEEASISATFKAERKGKHNISIIFHSAELKDIHGQCTIITDLETA